MVTLAARVLGFGRWLVFSQSVGATCVGSALPGRRTSYRMSSPRWRAGGAPAAVAVPIIAGQLADGAQDEAARPRLGHAHPGARLCWHPLSMVMAVAARPLSTLLVDGRGVLAPTDLMAAMLVVFAPQIAAVRRRYRSRGSAPGPSTLPAAAAACCSAQRQWSWRRTCSMPRAGARGESNDLTRLPVEGLHCAGGSELTRRALLRACPCSFRCTAPAYDCISTWALSPGVARRARALAGAGLLALVAQQVAVLVALWVSQHRGGSGTLEHRTPTSRRVLSPAVCRALAVPIAQQRLSRRAGDGHEPVGGRSGAADVGGRSGAADAVLIGAGDHGRHLRRCRCPVRRGPAHRCILQQPGRRPSQPVRPGGRWRPCPLP